MRPRELAHLLGFGRKYFSSFWSRSLPIYDTPQSFQDAAGAIFIHIPKTAGVSVCNAIYGTDQLFGHAPASGWREQDRKRYERLFVFSFMREPTERFFSAFYYLRGSALTQKDKDFSAKVLAPFDTPDALLDAMINDRFLRARVMSWVHFTPQSWYLTDQDGKLLVDYIGRVETFDESMSEIAMRLGKEYTPTHANTSKRPKKLSLSEKSQELINRLYREDFALYQENFGSAA